MFKPKGHKSGFSLVEVVIVASLSTVIFGALLFSFKYSLDLISHSRAKLSALSVANDRMEYFRSLPYDQVGVISGYPAGTIPQNSTTTLNGIEFVERVRVDYVDDDADGTAGADTNGIILDYKKLRLEYTWKIKDATSTIVLISNIVPRSIETTAGGGTARINVLDSDSTLLPGAEVRMFGSSTTFPYDVTSFTDASGATLFNVPQDSGYQVIVTANLLGNDYSTAKTYEATTSNPNPIVSPFAVIESDVSTLTFQIGELSNLDVTTFSSLTEDMFREEFTNLAAVASSSDVSTSGGELLLEDTAGIYDSKGFVYLGPIAPVTLDVWQTMRIATDVPVNTSHHVQFFTGAGAGPYTLIPEVDLPGNALGFASNIVDMSSLDSSVYPSIYVGVTLGTTDASVTPRVDELSIFYRESETLRPNVTFDIHGNKIIGTDAGVLPIYKSTSTLSTDGVGELTISDLEFDDYVFIPLGGLDIASACPAHPFVHQAGVDGNLDLVLVPGEVDTLRVTVLDSLGNSLPGVSVQLTRSGYDVTLLTNSCGQAFFTGGVSANTDYDINVTAAGYTDENLTTFEINEDTTTTIIMNE